jgi:Mn-dependent DtxR family transcriptional regulator
VIAMTTNESEALPRWLTERYRRILVTLKRQNGACGTIADIRRAAGLMIGGTGGDRYAKELIKKGLLRHRSTDDYVLTAEGYAMANKLIALGY